MFNALIPGGLVGHEPPELHARHASKNMRLCSAVCEEERVPSCLTSRDKGSSLYQRFREKDIYI